MEHAIFIQPQPSLALVINGSSDADVKNNIFQFKI